MAGAERPGGRTVVKKLQRRADVVVVGSGPGGATVARQMARAGKQVLLLEKGRDYQRIGNHLTALFMADKLGLSFTEEGMNIVRAFATGGSTLLYCGSAADPPEWLLSKYHIDLREYAQATKRELNVAPLPDEVLGSASHRLLEAANELGHRFEKMPKFIDPAKCKMRCGGTCMLGCPHGAKWSARAYIQDMIDAGGELMTRVDVQSVTVQDGVATGVHAFVPGGELTVEAGTVVVSAGGCATPMILQKSGISEAGRGMFVDPLVFVTGVSKYPGTCLGPPMGVATYAYIDEGVLLSDLIDPWGMWLVMTAMRNPGKLVQFPTYRKQFGLMVKIGDERQGYISMDGSISKPLTEQDRQRLNRGATLARDILIRAGCDPRSIMVGPVRGAHPGATARIGLVVDENLQTRIKNLYVSDASVLPEALDRPVVLTVISLSKRLADHLLSVN